MKLTNQLYELIESIDSKQFQLYLSVFLSLLVSIYLIIGLLFYRTTNTLYERILDINQEREETVQEILAYGAEVKQQQEDLNRILSEELDFKIAGYFDTLLQNLAIAHKKISIETPSQTRIDETYKEAILRAKFDMMNMKELTELLQMLEKNKRISTKQLEITKSTKNPGTLQVQLTIATMLLQTEF